MCKSNPNIEQLVNYAPTMHECGLKVFLNLQKK